MVRQAAGTSRAELRREGDVATCGGCGRRYPIVVGVPVLVTDAAA